MADTMGLARKAMKDIKYLSSLFEGLAALSVALGEAADLDKLIAERRAAAEQAGKELEDVQAAIVASLNASDAEVAEAKKAVASAKADAAKAKKETTAAYAISQKAIATAKEQAAAIIAAAEDKAAALVSGRNEALAKLDADISEAEIMLGNLTVQCDAAESRRVALLADIESVKARLG